MIEQTKQLQSSLTQNHTALDKLTQSIPNQLSKQQEQQLFNKPRSNTDIVYRLGDQQKYSVQQKQNNIILSNHHETSTNTFMDLFVLDINYSRHSNNQYLFLTGILQNDKRVIIKINNFKRYLHFVLKPDANQKQAKEQIRQLLRANDIKDFEGQIRDMKYVFEIKGIPRGDVRVYEVRYSFQSKNKPSPASSGHTYTYIIGTTYTPLQMFIIRNKIKGPQWLRINKNTLSKQNYKNMCTSQKVQYYQLLNSESIDSVSLKQNPLPSVRIMCISLKLGKLSQMGINIKGKKQQKNEFVIYSMNYVFYSNYRFGSKQTTTYQQSTSYYLNSFPQPKLTTDFNTTLKPFADQNTMLSHLINRITFLDPDIIVCHNFNSTLDVITSKLGAYRNQQMEKLGRIRLGENISQQKLPSQRISALTKGRIVLDTMRHAEQFIKTGDHKLSTLSSALNLKPINNISYEQAIMMVKSSQFNQIVNHTYYESINTFNVLSKLQILQTTLKLANICGYIWQKVLDQNKAQRNEYLIMHRCYEQGYVIPDKFYFQDEEYDGKYEGGMVLDPKKGLHNGYIVLLDFISLYPSIIREYNVCFSKIKRNLLPINHYVKTTIKEEVQQQFKVYPPEMQYCTQQNWGLLPKLIHMLVSEREKYKKLMNNSQTPEAKSVYNTTQIAYKLVANSIYGCLGYEKSRFYAKDLAALITRLGRQSLQNAKQIIENWRDNGEKCFDIVYGDTDSLMIKITLPQLQQQSTDQSLRKALRLMSLAAQQINSFYTMMKMQVDGVFASIFLAAKKKYAGNKLTNLAQIMKKPQIQQNIKPKFQIEYKGVQAIRNDSSQLLKDVSSKLFSILLQLSKNQSDIFNEVYEYFQILKDAIESHTQNDYNKYVLRKVLNKHPNLYIGEKGIPHVLVAKQLINQGHRPDSLINHMIQYLMVKKDQQTVPIDVNSYLKLKHQLKINKEYYKQRQIFPVVSRILKEIQKIDIQSIQSNFLGVKNKKKKQPARQQGYISIISQNNKQNEQLDNKLYQILGLLKCPGCDRKYKILRNGCLIQKCQDTTCAYNILGFKPLIVNTITLYLYEYTNKIYTNKYICQSCDKQWLVKVKKCQCGSTAFKQNHTLYIFHDNVYFLRKIIQSCFQKTDTNKQQLQLLLRSIDEILESSVFEIISANLFKRLKYNR